MSKEKNARPRTAVKPESIAGLLALVGLIVGMYMFLNPGGAGEYLEYAGPILPLSSLSGAEDVTARRHVELDFSPYGQGRERAVVTDTYELTNHSAEAVTVELVWGFEGNFMGDAAEIPSITVDGKTAEGELRASVDDRELVRYASSFEKYRQVLTENDFLAEAMAETPQPDVPVKVYHFYDVSYTGSWPQNAAFLDVAFDKGEDTRLWTRSQRVSGEADDGYHVKFDPHGEAWLYVIGEDIGDLRVAASKGFELDYDDPEALDEISYQLEVFDSTFAACLWEAAVDFDGQEPMTAQIRYDWAAKQILGNENLQPGQTVKTLDNLFDQAASHVRMLYLVFTVEIPAGGTVTVRGTYEQEGSRDLTGIWQGYDLATTLCSNLNFTAQTASIVNTQSIMLESGEQNFGFDPENGVTTVELDMAQEWYYLGILFAAE